MPAELVSVCAEKAGSAQQEQESCCIHHPLLCQEHNVCEYKSYMALMNYELYWTCKAGAKFAASLISAVSVYIHYSPTTEATESVSHHSDPAPETCNFLPLRFSLYL